MSLESKIEKLTAAVIALTERMAEMQPPAGEAQPDSEDSQPAAEAQRSEAVTIEQLQDLCMAIVRKDRGRKPDVKAAIAKYGDADTLKQVAESDYPALLADLEAL